MILTEQETVFTLIAVSCFLFNIIRLLFCLLITYFVFQRTIVIMSNCIINMKKSNLFILFFIILLSSCEKDDVTSGNEMEKSNEKHILALVNSYREKGCNCGSKYYPPVEPIAWNDLLESAAQKHSDDMNKNKFFSHTGSDGSKVGNRITNAGYNWAACGENIAKGYRLEDDVIKGWINSEGHCKNIMNPNFKEMGVAVSGDYWTQVFGKKR